MLTPTVIGKTFGPAVHAMPDKGKRFFEDLQRDGLLLVNRETLDYLESHLPFNTWTGVKELLIKRRISTRTWRGAASDESILPEVEVADSEINSPDSPITTTPSSYYACAPVIRRRSLLDGEYQCTSRDELWNLAFRPLVLALPLKSSEIVIVDQYLFNDIRRARKTDSQSPDEVGARWFVDQLIATVSPKQRCLIKIITAVTAKPNDQLLEPEMETIARDVFKLAADNGLDVEIHILPKHVPATIRDLIHGRRILMGPHSLITLDRGLSDFSLSQTAGFQFRVTRQNLWTDQRDSSMTPTLQIGYMRFGGDLAKAKILDPLLLRVAETGTVIRL